MRTILENRETLDKFVEKPNGFDNLTFLSSMWLGYSHATNTPIDYETIRYAIITVPASWQVALNGYHGNLVEKEKTHETSVKINGEISDKIVKPNVINKQEYNQTTFEQEYNQTIFGTILGITKVGICAGLAYGGGYLSGKIMTW